MTWFMQLLQFNLCPLIKNALYLSVSVGFCT
jgi:hypothetical protein